MVSDIPHLVAAICPDVFCQPQTRAAVKKVLRQSLAAGDRLAYLKAAEKAEPCEANTVALHQMEEINPFHLPGQRSPVQRHVLVLDHPDEPLEPLYFNLLDELQARGNWRVTILADTVAGTSGAGFSADLTRRVQQQEQQAVEQMGRIHTQMRALMQQWQKWRKEKEDLKIFSDARDSSRGENALRALQNRWRRNVNPDSAANDAAITGADFEAWREQSESEERQRVEMDRHLLAHQLRLLQLQAKWIKPYLPHFQMAGQEGDPAQVTAFNTALFELVLLVELPSEIEESVRRGDLPKLLLGKPHRPARSLVVVEFQFRAIPERTRAGSYAYRGRAELTFTSYALNDDELAVLRREIKREELGKLFGALEKNTPETLQQLLADLDELFAEPDARPKEARPPVEDTNPFSALFSIGEWFKPAPEEPGTPVIREPIRPDSEVEQVLRSCALLKARLACRELYEWEKRRWQMPVGKHRWRG
jgi:hypothetical protein